MKILEMKNISKSFGGTQALSEVSLTVNQGEIHALLGENGAGKSTLMNILTGVIPMDSGEIIFDGKHYNHPTIQQMERAGIAFVHQELNVVNDLTVSENIFLNREILTRYRTLDKKAMIKQTEALFERLGVSMDPRMMVSEMKTSQKQLLEICRALHEDAKLLILDEPTTALNNEEIAHLFGILKRLRDEGKSFIFISHKMPEIFEISDRYTVFRNGRFIREGNIHEVTAHEIASDMVGKMFVDKEIYRSRKLGDVILELKNYSGEIFHNINLKVRKGEIVAFTGLAGSGSSELLQTMFGVLRPSSGQCIIQGKPVAGGIRTFMRNKVAMLPANRKENSVIPDMTILENLYVAEHSLSRNRPVIHEKAELDNYDELKELLHIKADKPQDSINSLSGGNQQKVFFAKWLNIKADVLLFDNPTQGVDVGAKDEIYKLILEFAEEGKTIIINTLEIPEIKKIADRCIVFYEGEIKGSFEHDEVDEHTVMAYSTNAIDAVEGEQK